MGESGYERFETQNESGTRICFEFPRNSINGDDIVKEVKVILEGELRELLYKAKGDADENCQNSFTCKF